MKTVLIGTTNPSKASLFSDILADYPVRVVMLRDLGITDEPPEIGATPEENARMKAAFYGQYAPYVICADSGLYLDSLPMHDPRQPGLNIRTPGGCQRLDDEQMIAYYSALAHELGGRVPAYYLNGLAVKNESGIYSRLSTRREAMSWMFYLTDKPCPWRREGWPLDSLSQDQAGQYFLDPARTTLPQTENTEMPVIRSFLLRHLGFEE